MAKLEISDYVMIGVVVVLILVGIVCNEVLS